MHFMLKPKDLYRTRTYFTMSHAYYKTRDMYVMKVDGGFRAYAVDRHTRNDNKVIGEIFRTREEAVKDVERMLWERDGEPSTEWAKMPEKMTAMFDYIDSLRPEVAAMEAEERAAAKAEREARAKREQDAIILAEALARM